MNYPRRQYDGVRRFLPSFRQLLLLGLLGFLALVGVVGVAYARTSIPTPNEVATSQATILYYDDAKTELGRFGAQNRINVRLAEVPDRVQKAMLAAEDRGFYENRGISPTGIARAFWNNLKGGSTQGGSTITQQYAKNAYLTQERTYKRKLKEFFIAVKLDRRDNKSKILEDYLNTIYFGRGAYGIQTAAQAYFGKDVSKLTVGEGAVLASIVRSPAGYDPVRHPEAMAARFRYVLDGMVAKRWLPAAERTKVTVPAVRKQRTGATRSGPTYYLLDVARRELRTQGFSDADIDLGGLRVTTTFNRRAQAAAVRAVRKERPTQNAKSVHIGLSAVRPGDGAVVAMYGGGTVGGNNEATQARLQPGSSFKPFALAAALEDGVGLRSRYAGNSPYFLPGGRRKVNNEFNQSYGSSVGMIKATADSINTAYVDMTLDIGPRKVVDSAVRAGIPKDTPALRAEATVTLGTASVRNIDMANAYATFAARGRATQWYVVKEVKGPNGGSRYKARPKKSKAYSQGVAADVTYALRQVVTGGTGTRALGVGRPVAAKTGTAALRPDTTTSSWFVGYAPQLSAAVDIYKGDGTKDLDGVGGLSTFFGGNYPARIWTAFMKGALKGTKVREFPPASFVGRTVNPAPVFTPRPRRSSGSSSPSGSATGSPSGSPSGSATVPPPSPPVTPPAPSPAAPAPAAPAPAAPAPAAPAQATPAQAAPAQPVPVGGGG